ncbi:hypothetical protein, partial [Xanthomonas vasicola]|uniref:hypothetical protein n=1 Tax=Xanthomonas vasicola TaxID=56459 RepID=UPI001C71F1F6
MEPHSIGRGRLQRYALIQSRISNLQSRAAIGGLRDGLINATGKRSNRIRRAEGAQIADFLPVSARLRGVAWITGT